MDLSKLPRMSDTRKGEAERLDQPRQAQVSSGAGETGADSGNLTIPYASRRVVAVDAGPSGWISLIVGILLILFWPRIWQWLAHSLFGTAFTWTFSDAAGSPLSYERSVFIWGDAAIALYAAALLLDGIVLIWISNSRAALWVAFVALVLALTFNAGFFVISLVQGMGLPLVSVLAVIFGIFMCHQQWQILKGPKRRYLLIEES